MMKRSQWIGLALLLILAVAAVSSRPSSAQGRRQAQSASSWPQWRGPERNGLSSETGLLTNWQNKEPQLLWMGEGLGQGYASVTISDGILYTTGNFPNGQAVVAVDTSDGKVIWKTPITSEPPSHSYPGSRSTPTIDGDRLYVVSSDGNIISLQRAKGTIVWRKSFRDNWNGRMMSGWGFSESPLVDGDRVICTPGGEQAMLVALNKSNGDEIWRSALPADAQQRGLGPGAGYSSAIVTRGGGMKQYVQLVGSGVIGVRAEDGKFLWGYTRIANDVANIPTPIASGEFIFCSAGYQAGSALLRLRKSRSGVEAEEVYFLEGNQLQNHHGGMVLVDGYIYCGHGHNNGFPVCVELRTGKIAWGGDKRGPGRGSAAVLYADGHLIFRYQSGEVALIEATPKRYNLKGVLKPAYQEENSWAHPVICGGRLYLREQDKLMCYDLSP